MAYSKVLHSVGQLTPHAIRERQAGGGVAFATRAHTMPATSETSRGGDSKWPLAATLLAAIGLWLTLLPAGTTIAQSSLPSARLVPAALLRLPAEADSNSPAVWDLVNGVERLFVFTSAGGRSVRHFGAQLASLTAPSPVTFANHPGHGVWMESIVPDTDGTWYGFYHQERPAEVCDDAVRTIPRIGSARSNDYGGTWQDLGIVLEAPPASYDCASTNRYFVGGVGDFSVTLDHDAQYLYVFFSQYANREAVQGVSVARLAWADRDDPAGKAAVWLRGDTWLPTRTYGMRGALRHIHAAGAPVFRAADGWHDDGVVDAFWGPSVHYNTYLERYVMLLNRARDSTWSQEGIYVSYSTTLDDPTTWSVPQRLLASGRWYPQVIGLEASTGTDRAAGQRARFFMGGRSEYLIEFTR